MLEQSLRKLFEQQAEAEPPRGLITVASVLRQGRLRRRRHRIGTVGTPVVAAVAIAAIALTGALPSGTSGRPSPPAGYGKLVGGAFDPSHLVIGFGWLPKDTLVMNGETSPSVEALSTAGPHREAWVLGVYARGSCHVKKTTRQFTCSPEPSQVLKLSTKRPITGQGPVIDGHRSLQLGSGADLAWQYATDAWAVVLQRWGLTNANNAERIARAVEYGQPAPNKYGQDGSIAFASRFTSLRRGWRIVGVVFTRQDGGYMAFQYQIARLRTISPATPTGIFIVGEPLIQVTPAGYGTSCGVGGGSTQRRETIDGYRFALSDFRTKHHGVVTSFQYMCGNHLDGLMVVISEMGVGAHPGFVPTKVMEQLQLLGTNPANWVTNPLP